MRRFVAFIVYAENSVKNYTNGRFVPEDFPAGVEEVNCSTLQVSKIKPEVKLYIVGAVINCEECEVSCFSLVVLMRQLNGLNTLVSL